LGEIQIQDNLVLWKPGESIFTERHTHRKETTVDIRFPPDARLKMGGVSCVSFAIVSAHIS
jgi:hypothetical protein